MGPSGGQWRPSVAPSRLCSVRKSRLLLRRPLIGRAKVESVAVASIWPSLYGSHWLAGSLARLDRLDRAYNRWTIEPTESAITDLNGDLYEKSTFARRCGYLSTLAVMLTSGRLTLG